MPTIDFKGKTFVQNYHLAVKNHLLIPKKELSLTNEISMHDNLIIQGNNLNALKALLPNYAGKIKCVYIDPPLNTRKEKWIYNDNIGTPMMLEWFGKEVDMEDLTCHDKWLCMMMPRLKLLHELLKEDGAIFISCDDIELQYLRMLLDEIFGDANFYSQVTVNANSRRQVNNRTAKALEYLIIYTKTPRKNLAGKKKNGNSNGMDETHLKTMLSSEPIWEAHSFLNKVGAIELRELGLQNKFVSPKPKALIKRCIELSTDKDDIVLDSFAGSGTTANAALELNKESGIERKFILIEMEWYANEVTAERVRRAIKGTGKAKSGILQKGTGGTFSYFELGRPIEVGPLLKGNNLPSFTEFARYLFYTATGEEFNEKSVNEKTGFIGESKNYEVYLLYKPDIAWLKENALMLKHCKSLPKFINKQRLIFAPTKYVDNHTLNEYRIDFCHLPFEIYRKRNGICKSN